MRTVTLIVVLVALASEFAGAQQPKAAFEVASVKRSESGALPTSGWPGMGANTAFRCHRTCSHRSVPRAGERDAANSS